MRPVFGDLGCACKKSGLTAVVTHCCLDFVNRFLQPGNWSCSIQISVRTLLSARSDIRSG